MIKKQNRYRRKVSGIKFQWNPYNKRAIPNPARPFIFAQSILWRTDSKRRIFVFLLITYAYVILDKKILVNFLFVFLGIFNRKHR